jgi:hypothetical protein
MQQHTAHAREIRSCQVITGYRFREMTLPINKKIADFYELRK